MIVVNIPLWLVMVQLPMGLMINSLWFDAVDRDFFVAPARPPEGQAAVVDAVGGLAGRFIVEQDPSTRIKQQRVNNDSLSATNSNKMHLMGYIPKSIGKDGLYQRSFLVITLDMMTGSIYHHWILHIDIHWFVWGKLQGDFVHQRLGWWRIPVNMSCCTLWFRNGSDKELMVYPQGVGSQHD